MCPRENSQKEGRLTNRRVDEANELAVSAILEEELSQREQNRIRAVGIALMKRRWPPGTRAKKLKGKKQFAFCKCQKMHSGGYRGGNRF